METSDSPTAPNVTAGSSAPVVPPPAQGQGKKSTQGRFRRRSLDVKVINFNCCGIAGRDGEKFEAMCRLFKQRSYDIVVLTETRQTQMPARKDISKMLESTRVAGANNRDSWRRIAFSAAAASSNHRPKLLACRYCGKSYATAGWWLRHERTCMRP
jgi:hypothetical protein